MTAFVFPTAVEPGAAYEVTVQTQAVSPAVFCFVIDVLVDCVASTYTIGGSINDLDGSGLIPAMNGQSLIAPASATNFSFPKAVVSGTPYAVTIQTQPDSPTQVCTVANGTGTVCNGNVTTVQVDCTTVALAADLEIGLTASAAQVRAGTGHYLPRRRHERRTRCGASDLHRHRSDTHVPSCLP